MFTALSFVLASAVLISSGDTVKKKPAPAPVAAPVTKPAKVASSARREKPQQAPASVALAGTRQENAVPAAAKAPAKQPLLGASIGKGLSAAVRGVAPRATYLSAAIRSRATSGPPLPAHIRANPNAIAIHADSIVVEKSRRTMTLYDKGMPVRIYFIALGQNPVGDKTARGDNRTPEGLYYIDGHNPASKYHLSLRVSYPNAQDVAEAGARGIAAGGDIMIHGLPRGFESVGPDHRKRDWTNGCIAVTNAEIEEIWTAIPDGAAIHIKP